MLLSDPISLCSFSTILISSAVLTKSFKMALHVFRSKFTRGNSNPSPPPASLGLFPRILFFRNLNSFQQRSAMLFISSTFCYPCSSFWKPFPHFVTEQFGYSSLSCFDLTRLILLIIQVVEKESCLSPISSCENTASILSSLTLLNMYSYIFPSNVPHLSPKSHNSLSLPLSKYVSSLYNHISVQNRAFSILSILSQ